MHHTKIDLRPKNKEVFFLYHTYASHSALSGHEALAFYISKIPNVTVILAVNRAPMSHISRIVVVSNCTGKSFSEALILASTITHNMTKDCSLNYEFSTFPIPSSKHVACINCSECQNKNNFHVLNS